MSEVLVRIRIRETAGIRRFLYPLTASVALPIDVHPQHLRLSDGEKDIPVQVSHKSEFRVDFAISLDPHAEQELILSTGKSSAGLDDPLILTTRKGDKLLSNRQRRFAIDLQDNGIIGEVVYDSVAHLRRPLEITRNGVFALNSSRIFHKVAPDFSALCAWASASCRYPDGVAGGTNAEITACKSWATVTHTVKDAQPNDEVVFTLPLAITSPTLTCDFGVGGYVFGKLDSAATEIVWHTEFGEAPYAKWTVATAGRVDYVGEVETAEAFISQRWFHLIDSNKALAVAITRLPEGCQSMTVRLTHDGDVSIAFKLGGKAETVAAFGVCYHFLNDVPAIAAATNPQSILLPPVVEVLPVG